MQELKIYGSSDDLIEVEGAIREEFTYEDSTDKLFVSDGTVLSVVYDNEGMWRINCVVSGTAGYWKEEATDADKGYSDVVTLVPVDDPFTWIGHGTEWGKPNPPVES